MGITALEPVPEADLQSMQAQGCRGPLESLCLLDLGLGEAQTPGCSSSWSQVEARRVFLIFPEFPHPQYRHCAPCRASDRNTQLSDGLGRGDIPHTLTNQEFKHNDCSLLPLGALSLNSPCANWRARQHHPPPCSQPRMEMSWAALPTKSRSPCKTPAASGALHDFQFSQEVKSKQQQASNSLFPTLLCLPPSAARALLPICCFGC